MPIARSRVAPWQVAVAVGVAGVLVAVILVAAVVLISGSGDVEVRLGDDVFEAGRADALAESIDEDGPVLFSDASPNRSRDIFLQHLSDDVDEGWLAFAAQAPGADRECHLEWQVEEDEFLDPCSDRRYPADGRGLTQYEVRVSDGDLFVDLREPVEAP